MFLLFTSVAVLALHYIVQAGGGWFASVEQLAVYGDKPGIISWHGVVGPDTNWLTPADGLVWALILGAAWGAVVAVSPWQSSRYLMARSEHVVVRSACGASIAVLLFYLATMFGAAAVNLTNPDVEPPESTMIWVAMNLMPTVAGAVLVSGILAAGLSSASTFLSLVGFSAGNDIFRHSEDPQKQLRSTRYTMVGIGLIVIVLCFGCPEKHLLDYLFRRDCICIILGRRCLHEHLEQAHHRNSRILGNGDRLPRQYRNQSRVIARGRQAARVPGPDPGRRHH